jgi:hypothetical protein
MPRGIPNKKTEDEVKEVVDQTVKNAEEEIEASVENTVSDDGSLSSESGQEPVQEEGTGLPPSNSDESTPEASEGSTDSETIENQEDSENLNKQETPDEDPNCELCGSTLNLIADSNETECSNQECENSATQKKAKVAAEAEMKADLEAKAKADAESQESKSDEIVEDGSGYSVGDEIQLKLPTIRLYATSKAKEYVRVPGPLYIYDTLVQYGSIRVTDKKKDGKYLGWVALSDMAN